MFGIFVKSKKKWWNGGLQESVRFDTVGDRLRTLFLNNLAA